MLKKFKLLLSVVMVMALCFGSITALAADPIDDDDDDTVVASGESLPVQAAISKVLQLPVGTNTPNATFTFNAEKISLDEDTSDEALSTMPDLLKENLTVSFTQADKDENDPINNIMYVVKETNDIFAGVTFPHAGIYVYEITEIVETNPDIDNNDPHEVLTYSEAKYTITVYVSNDASGTGTYIAGIGTRITTNDDGQPGDGSKIDTTPGGNGVDYFYSQMIFNNTYVKTNGAENPDDPDPTSEQALSVTKTVTGDYASQEQYFDFSITLEIPSLVRDVPEYYRAYIVENGAVIDPVNNADAGAIGSDAGGGYIKISTDGATAFSLKHSQKLVFVDTPVGTSYKVTEAAATNYIPSHLVTTNSVPGNNVTGTMSTALSTDTQFVGEAVNSADFTNNRESVTPTGLNLNDLPFIGLIALAIASLVVFIVVKSRKKDTADNA